MHGNHGMVKVWASKLLLRQPKHGFIVMVNKNVKVNCRPVTGHRFPFPTWKSDMPHTLPSPRPPHWLTNRRAHYFLHWQWTLTMEVNREVQNCPMGTISRILGWLKDGFWRWMWMSFFIFFWPFTDGQWLWPLPSVEECSDQFWVLMLSVSWRFMCPGSLLFH